MWWNGAIPATWEKISAVVSNDEILVRLKSGIEKIERLQK